MIAILAAPAAVMTACPNKFYFVRSLVAPFQTLLMLIASEVGLLANVRSVVVRRLVLTTDLLASGITLRSDTVLIHRVRADYRGPLPLAKECDATVGPALITLGTIRGLPTPPVVAFHQEKLSCRAINVLPSREFPPEGADSFILNHMAHDDFRAHSRIDHHGICYRLVNSKRSGGPTETHWHLDCREAVHPHASTHL